MNLPPRRQLKHAPNWCTTIWEKISNNVGCASKFCSDLVKMNIWRRLYDANLMNFWKFMQLNVLKKMHFLRWICVEVSNWGKGLSLILILCYLFLTLSSSELQARPISLWLTKKNTCFQLRWLLNCPYHFTEPCVQEMGQDYRETIT